MLRKIITISLLAGLTASCTKNFQTLNVNPTAPATVPLDYLFAQSQLLYAGSAGDPGYFEWRANLYYSMPIVQQMASLGTTYNGDKYVWSNEASGAYFGTSTGSGNYPNSVKNLVNLIYQARLDSVKNVNILSMARITKVMLMSIMTDLYGDIPYFQAGLGYISGTLTPAYDPQKSIYPDLLNELSQAGAALTTSAYIPSASDFAFSGNITSWKHFANSLMLRLAMRLQKVDPTSAAAWATRAISGGVMTSNKETYLLNYPGGGTASINPHSYNLGPSDKVARNVVAGAVLQWSNTFINTMKARQDPRIGMVSNIGVTQTTDNQILMGDSVGSHQLGLPNGLDNAPAGTNISQYSVMNPLIFKSTAPDIILSYAEVEFLKAEAEARGYVTGTPATEYALGQEAALQQMSSFNAAFAFTPAQVTAYQTANPYPTTGLEDGVKAIQTELWLHWGDTFNGYEAWASYRRTGYPVLTPVNYPGNATNGTIPRRLQYPSEQKTLDAAGYQAANGRMGDDVMTTRVWWDGGKD